MQINNINTKYDIGQELYKIKLNHKSTTKCECCGSNKISGKYVVDETTYEIIGVYVKKNKETQYTIIPHGVISESEVEKEFFLTKEAAQAECDKRNCAKEKSQTERIRIWGDDDFEPCFRYYKD